MPIKYLTTLRILGLVVLGAALSCGHFQGPSYGEGHALDTQAEMATPDELYDSPQVLDSEPRRTVGPFRLQWPVHKISMSRAFSTSGRRAHLGLDLTGHKGDPIMAAHDGVVIYAGHAFKGYGKMIILEYDKTWATLYGHMSGFKVKMGQEVTAGQVIGLMGRTGRATGVHLHFELMRDKQPVDPEPMLNESNAVELRRPAEQRTR